MKLVLLGNPRTKRTEYFYKAAQNLGQKITFCQLPLMTCLHDFDYEQFSDCTVKVDPPLWELNCLDDLNEAMPHYHQFLYKLAQVPGIRLLNSCEALWQTLDKLVCKKRLQEEGLPVTPLLDPVHSLAQLLEMMSEKRVYQVFIKPRLGSGAAGVTALRFHPQTGSVILETSCRLAGGRLYNTNKLSKTNDFRNNQELIDCLLAQGAILEKWIPKASYQGQVYDLRAVFQFGCIEYIVVRRSQGAITNLHLNNSALALESLNLSPNQLAEIESLCHKAAGLFPGLNAAGIDILLERNSMQPMIIEINGQGDLVYQDIFAKNCIYTAQIRGMLSL